MIQTPMPITDGSLVQLNDDHNNYDNENENENNSNSECDSNKNKQNLEIAKNIDSLQDKSMQHSGPDLNNAEISETEAIKNVLLPELNTLLHIQLDQIKKIETETKQNLKKNWLKIKE